jgi:small GTP-binding protein
MAVTLDNNRLVIPLANLHEEIQRAGQAELAQKIQDIQRRVEDGLTEVYVAFCGLFSAGKSSLINALTKTSQLATGAVPTTAEVAAVRYETPSGAVVLLDTPGVDSTDEAHQAATEAALHMSDVVFFVMDYQHVESEENMELARSFVDRGKTLYLVVNQVDKHVDWELSFAEFQQRVEQTFSDYGIVYEKIYYTSTKTSAVNEINELVEELHRLAVDGHEVVCNSVLRTVESLTEQFVSTVFEPKLQAAENALYDTVGFVPFDEAEANEWICERNEKLATLRESVNREQESISKTYDALHEDVRRLVDLAQISPYETTEKGRLYVESLRQNFKVGLLGSKQKTAAERERRLQAFLEDLTDRTEKYLVWPLQSRLREWVDNTPWANSEWRNDIDTVGVSIEAALCRDLVNPGALSSDQYPYQYVKDVVGKVKSGVLASVNRVLDLWNEHVCEFRAELERSRQPEVDALQNEVDAIRRWVSLTAEQQGELTRLLDPVRNVFSTCEGGSSCPTSM